MQYSCYKYAQMKPILLIIPFLVFFSSCDPGTTYTRALQNNTNKTIIIKFHHQSVRGYPEDTIWIKPARISTLFVNGHIGGNPDPHEPMYKIDSVDIMAEEATITKDIMLPENWEIKTKKHGRNYDHAYIFTVNQTDLN